MQVAHAATAQTGMVGMGTDIVAHVPATLTLGVLKRRSDDLFVVVADCHSVAAADKSGNVV